MEAAHETDDEKDEQKEIQVPNVLPPFEGKEQECLAAAAKFGDRRDHINKPWEHPNAIIRCTGRILSWYGDKINGKPVFEMGTGTVFKVQNGEAFIITVAHNVIRRNPNNDQGQHPLRIFFRRREEGPDLGLAVDYEAQTWEIHERFTFRKTCNWDLALLTITDINMCYEKFFEEHGNIIHWKCSEGIFTVPEYSENKYGIYGYPRARNNDHSQIKDGQMWGMEANAHKNEKVENDEKVYEMYIKERKHGTHIDYNAIDTDSGQSGSALYLKYQDKESIKDKYAIIGVHSCGSADKNFAVALNKSNKEWITVLGRLRKPIPLEIHSHRGHNKNYHPKHLLKNTIDHYRSDMNTAAKEDWIIFKLKNEKDAKHIGKIRIKNYHHGTALAEFSLYIGYTNDWGKMHSSTLKAETKDGYQYFFLKRGFRTDVHGTMFKLVMKGHIIKFYEFALMETIYRWPYVS